MKIKGAESKLEKAVQRILNDRPADEVQGFIEDVLQHGCQSGIVGELIYYGDTTKFYTKHQREIQAMVLELSEDCGCSIQSLFGDKWDKEDPFCSDVYNQNLLAWFGFEETTRRLAQRNGMEA